MRGQALVDEVALWLLASVVSRYMCKVVVYHSFVDNDNEHIHDIACRLNVNGSSVSTELGNGVDAIILSRITPVWT